MDIKVLGNKYNLAEVDEKLGNNFWKPLDVAKIDDWILKVAAFKGQFHWHKHKEDEFFLIYKGEIIIDTENGSIELKVGEGTVIPKGVLHRPRAVKRAVVLMLEPDRVDAKGD